MKVATGTENKHNFPQSYSLGEVFYTFYTRFTVDFTAFLRRRNKTKQRSLLSSSFSGFHTKKLEAEVFNVSMPSWLKLTHVVFSNHIDFFRLLLSNCLNWKIYCDDHSSL